MPGPRRLHAYKKQTLTSHPHAGDSSLTSGCPRLSKLVFQGCVIVVERSPIFWAPPYLASPASVGKKRPTSGPRTAEAPELLAHEDRRNLLHVRSCPAQVPALHYYAAHVHARGLRAPFHFIQGTLSSQSAQETFCPLRAPTVIDSRVSKCNRNIGLSRPTRRVVFLSSAT